MDTAQVAEGHAVAMRNGSYFNTAENLNKIPKIVTLKIYNPTSSSITIRPQYSTNNGQSWKTLDTYIYEYPVAAGTSTKVTITEFPTNVPIMLRFRESSGSSSEYCFIDDIEISYENTWTPEFIPGDVNGDGLVNVADVTLLINYNLNDGGDIIVEAADLDGNTEINITDIVQLISMVLNAEQ